MSQPVSNTFSVSIPYIDPEISKTLVEINRHLQILYQSIALQTERLNRMDARMRQIEQALRDTDHLTK